MVSYTHIFGGLHLMQCSTKEPDTGVVLCLHLSGSTETGTVFIIYYYYWLLGVPLVIGTVQTRNTKYSSVPKCLWSRDQTSKEVDRFLKEEEEGGGRRRWKKIKLVCSCCFTKSKRKISFGLMWFVGFMSSCSCRVLGVTPPVTAPFPSLGSFLLQSRRYSTPALLLKCFMAYSSRRLEEKDQNVQSDHTQKSDGSQNCILRCDRWTGNHTYDSSSWGLGGPWLLCSTCGSAEGTFLFWVMKVATHNRQSVRHEKLEPDLSSSWVSHQALVHLRAKHVCIMSGWKQTTVRERILCRYINNCLGGRIKYFNVILWDKYV